jgi:N-[(2S)-2-amino-2-carboxyethyl]-L-glutamate dehydrogenase
MDTDLDLLFLSEPEMIEAGVTDIVRCIDVMEETLVLLSQGDYMMAGENHDSHGAMITFPEIPVHAGMPADGPDRRFMAMPAYLGGRFGTTGVKWYGSNAENKKKGLPRSIHLFTLNDTDTGAPLAVMSGNLLSAYRTGAVPNVGVKHLAREDVTTLAIIGPGVMARTTAEGVLALRPGITTVKVKGRGAASAERFAQELAAKHPQLSSVTVVDSVEEAVRDAGVVISTPTTAAEGSSGFPLIKEEWIAKGALLLLPAAAAFEDEFLINRARKVVDYLGLYDAWNEEYGTEAYEQIGIVGSHFIDLVANGEMERSAIHQIGDIVSGKAPGRTDDDEIILYSVGGMPVEDVAWGTDLYESARANGIGTRLNIWAAPALA